MRSAHPAPPAERLLRARLVLHCKARHLAFKVAQRTDGTWRGVVFSLDTIDLRSHTSETRASLLRELVWLVDANWPVSRGATHANRQAKKQRLAEEQRRAAS